MLRSRLAGTVRPLLTCKRVKPIVGRAMATHVDTECTTPDAATFCKEFVAKQDYEALLVSQFYPKQRQAGYFALRAFYVELAMIQDQVSNPMIGKMRMQFWRDAVKDISDGKSPRHPIALALFDASQKAHLPGYHLKRIVDARDEELQNSTHLTTTTLTAHAEATSSSFLYLILSLLSLSPPNISADISSTLSHATSHLGVAQTLSTLLRALPFHVGKGRMVIPAEITARCGVNQEEVFNLGAAGAGGAKGMSDAVYEFATLANDHLLTARDMFKEMNGKVPAEAMPAFLPGVAAASYLSRLEAVNFDAFHPSLQLRDWRLPWNIWRGFYKREF